MISYTYWDINQLKWYDRLAPINTSTSITMIDLKLTHMRIQQSLVLIWEFLNTSCWQWCSTVACGHKTRAIAYKQHKFCLITYSKSDKNVLENLSQCAWCWRRRQTHLPALTFFRLVGFSKTAFAHINHIHHFSVAFKRSICLAILGPLHVRIGNKCCGHFNYLHHFGFFPFILHVACVWVSYLLELHHHHHTLIF